ncbi:kinase-like protein [Xylariaceae sp. FL0255]|nr:kinase-like protein [Xylariaceae sp. FL0255]
MNLACSLSTICKELKRHLTNALYDGRFVPDDELKKIFTRSSISKIAKQVFARHTDTQRASIIDQILSYIKPDQQNTRLRLFATLVWIREPEAIKAFQDQGITDTHLPFFLENGILKYSVNPGGPSQPIHWLGDQNHIYDVLLLNQWKFLPPVFKFNSTETSKAPHAVFRPGIQLPFLRDESPEIREGGFAEVQRRKIHQAHHDLKSRYDEGAFKREVEALDRFRDPGHPHIIKLLATYCIGRDCYMMFPWADDDLKTFWRQVPPPKPLASTSQWMLEQCIGIAQGLQAVHSSHPAPQSERLDVNGRHGDVTPQNILRFVPQPGGESCQLGTLKISDFGLARFHREESSYRPFSRDFCCTLTYSAPDDLNSRSWDIWQLGCIYLEFLIWLLLGWDGIAQFSHARLQEDVFHLPHFKADRFFNYNASLKRNYVKESAKDRIDILHNHPSCTSLINDFLEIISEKLLRIRPEVRYDCDDLVKDLKKLQAQCQDNTSYYTKHKEKVPKRPTHESDTASPSYCKRAGTPQEKSNTEALARLAVPLTAGHSESGQSTSGDDFEEQQIKYIMYDPKPNFKSVFASCGHN